MRSRLLLTLLLTSVAATASAQELRSVPPTPQDFSWQWPLSINSNDDLVRVSLTAEVYARLWRDDVGDVVVFNGANEPVSMAPMRSLRSAQATMASSATSLLDVPPFRLPAGTPKNSSERVRLQAGVTHHFVCAHVAQQDRHKHVNEARGNHQILGLQCKDHAAGKGPDQSIPVDPWQYRCDRYSPKCDSG